MFWLKNEASASQFWLLGQATLKSSVSENLFFVNIFIKNLNWLYLESVEIELRESL